jgi:hypothetical protein
MFEAEARALAAGDDEKRHFAIAKCRFAKLPVVVDLGMRLGGPRQRSEPLQLRYSILVMAARVQALQFFEIELFDLRDEISLFVGTLSIPTGNDMVLAALLQTATQIGGDFHGALRFVPPARSANKDRPC